MASGVPRDEERRIEFCRPINNFRSDPHRLPPTFPPLFCTNFQTHPAALDWPKLTLSTEPNTELNQALVFAPPLRFHTQGDFGQADLCDAFFRCLTQRSTPNREREKTFSDRLNGRRAQKRIDWRRKSNKSRSSWRRCLIAQRPRRIILRDQVAGGRSKSLARELGDLRRRTNVHATARDIE
jgi:hypothetical protein